MCGVTFWLTIIVDYDYYDLISSFPLIIITVKYVNSSMLDPFLSLMINTW